LLTSKPQNRKRLVVVPRKLGLPLGLSYDNVEQLLEAVEGSTHR
jgi:hypothetical protein